MRFDLRVFVIVTIVFMSMLLSVFEWSQTTFIMNHEGAHAQNCLYQGGEPVFVYGETGRVADYHVVCDINGANHKYDFDSINESIGYQLLPILYSTFLYGFIILMYLATIAGVFMTNQKA